MKKLSVCAMIGLLASGLLLANSSGQQPEDIAIINGVRYRKEPETNRVMVLVYTNTVPVSPPIRHTRVIRQFQKECPECGHQCVSTNLTWNGSHTEPDRTLVRDGRVTFTCQVQGCGETFSEEIHRAVRKTAPMAELPPIPTP